MSNLQKIFDNAYQHIIVEKNPPGVERKSFNTYPCPFKCSYSTANGNACAIGVSLVGHEEVLNEIEIVHMEMDFGKLYLYNTEKIEQIFPGLREEVLELIHNMKEYYDLIPDSEDQVYEEEYISEFLEAFQLDLHDSLVNLDTGEWRYTFDELKEKYIEVAKKYNLTIPEGS